MSIESGEAVKAGETGATHALDRLEKASEWVTRPLATLGVLGMLVAAGATVVDVLWRWLFNGGVVALNEITSMAFAIAIAACIPSGLAGGVNLKIDIFSRWLSGRLAIWLDAFGAFSLLFFFALLTQQIYVHAGKLAAQGRTTVILGWHQAPFMYAVVALLAVGALIQAVVTSNFIRRAWAYEKPAVDKSWPIVACIAALMGAFVVAIAIYAIVDFTGMSRWSQDNPVKAVGIAFAVMWIFMLGLMPLAR